MMNPCAEKAVMYCLQYVFNKFVLVHGLSKRGACNIHFSGIPKSNHYNQNSQVHLDTGSSPV